MGGYLCRPPINDIVALIVPWCLETLVDGDIDLQDKWIELNFCVLVAVAIYFIQIAEEIFENCALGGLGKLLEAELEVMDEDRVVRCEAYLGEIILIYC